MKRKDYKKVICTLSCVLGLTIGLFLYKSLDAKNIIHENSKELQNLNFLVYVDDVLQKEIPNKESGYSLDTSRSHCENGTLVSWNESKWSVEIKEISTTKTKCYLYFEKLYQEEELNKAVPNLGNELVPITFNETGKAIKADLTKEWYNYKEQRWANAVILKTPENYQPETEIPEENIESYFVWIPRYEYEIWNGEEETLKFTGFETIAEAIEDTSTEPQINKQKPINIKFVTKNDEIKNGNTKGSWLTHPAFTSFNVDGFWVGKFETGYNQDLENEETITPVGWTVGGAQQNKIASENVIIKPNVYSWRSIQVGNAFYTAYDYKRELDSHMMKNMEWGAVAYFATSKYGLCKGGTCTNIFPNNNSGFITGYASSKEPTCGHTGTNIDCNKYEGTALGENGTYTYNYNDPQSQKASTTGNYYGVYDMSGGAWEYVMGIMLNESNTTPLSGRNKTYNSKFNGPFGNDTENTELTDELPWPAAKYYDTYIYNANDQQYQRGKLGDATKEVGPFYEITSMRALRRTSSYDADYARFTYSDLPWFIRGSVWNSGSESGLMAFGNGNGYTDGSYSFRIVLSPY